jgi:hypothetical protein
LDRGDAAAQGEAFECLVEADGDQEYYEGWTGGDGDGHADEDTVEKNSCFKE